MRSTQVFGAPHRKLGGSNTTDSDTEPGGEVTEVEEEEDDDRGYMGCGQPSDSEETVYPLLSEESSKSRVSFAKSLTHSLEEAAVIGGNGASLKFPGEEEEDVTGEAGGEAQGRSAEAQEPKSGNEREEERQPDIEDMEVAMARKRSAEVDSDTLIEAAEEAMGGKKRTVEVRVKDSSSLFQDADSDILLEAMEISLGRKKKSESVFFKDSDEEAERFLV